MNILAPISSIMTKDLVTVMPSDNLEKVKTLLDTHNIHHLPVVRYNQIVGIISSVDFNHFLRGFTRNVQDSLIEAARLRAWTAEEIMTEKLAKVEAADPIRVALDVFKLNRIHALPVEENGKLVGIITTYDIIKLLSEEQVNLSDYAAAS